MNKHKNKNRKHIIRYHNHFSLLLYKETTMNCIHWNQKLKTFSSWRLEFSKLDRYTHTRTRIYEISKTIYGKNSWNNFILRLLVAFEELIGWKLIRAYLFRKKKICLSNTEKRILGWNELNILMGIKQITYYSTVWYVSW